MTTDTEPPYADKIERRPIEGLIPYARNPRTHSAAQVAQIAASIREFGFTNPILVDGRGGIIAGHGRVLAARQLGLGEVPVLVLDHLSETQKRAYVIADNKLALNAGWDEELLTLELQDLRLAGFDAELTGYTADEIDQLIAELEGRGGGLTDADVVPETPVRLVTQPGDLWLLGQHRLLCGDALQPKAYSDVLAGGLADMVFTDPPYNVAYVGSASDKKDGRVRTVRNDDLGESFGSFLHAACLQMLAVTKNEFWQLLSGPPKTMAALPLANGLAGGSSQRGARGARGSLALPPQARWFARRLSALRGAQILQIVTSLDEEMNNTSLILLFEFGGRKLLFPGDAQLENWRYALQEVGDGKKAAKNVILLSDIDFYKVGHHGSLNATPKRMLWAHLTRRKAAGAARLRTMMSTMPGKHPGKIDGIGEVPRKPLVKALIEETVLANTDDLKKSKDPAKTEWFQEITIQAVD